MYNELKRPLADRIPPADDINRAEEFAQKLSDRLLMLCKIIDENGSLDICRDVLLYNSGDETQNSRLHLHMPDDDEKYYEIWQRAGAPEFYCDSHEKNPAQIKASDMMIKYNKEASVCFIDARKGYKLIIMSLIDQIDNIINWLRNKDKNECDIIFTETAVGAAADHFYEDLGPDCDIEDVLLAPRFNAYYSDPDSDAVSIYAPPVGYGFFKDYSGEIQDFSSCGMVVRLRKNECSTDDPLGFNGMGFYVYSAYPQYPEQ